MTHEELELECKLIEEAIHRAADEAGPQAMREFFAGYRLPQLLDIAEHVGAKLNANFDEMHGILEQKAKNGSN